MPTEEPILDGFTITGQPSAVVTSSGADRKSTRLNSSHSQISYAVFCLKKKKSRSAAPSTFAIRMQGSPSRDRCSARFLGRLPCYWLRDCPSTDANATHSELSSAEPDRD